MMTLGGRLDDIGLRDIWFGGTLKTVPFIGK
jgi:hypothetical protein